MSRIDQALSRIHQSGLPAQQDGDAPADPWDVAALAPPPTAEDADLADPWSVESPAIERPAAPLASTPTAPIQPPPQSERANDLVAGAPDGRDSAVGRLFTEKVVGGQLPAHAVEEYRRLGAFVHHLQTERGVRVVMVTSAVASEGKTLTAANLGVVLSASYGRSVLLVDADLRRPSLHQVFNTVSLQGLGDILIGKETPPLVQVRPRLTLLTAGEPNADPLGGLTSDRMRQVLAEAKETFDFVIVDTPPVGLLTDANLLAAMVDVALLVVRAASTPYDLVKRATDAIGRHRIAGIVLNRTEARDLHQSDYYDEYNAGSRARRQG